MAKQKTGKKKVNIEFIAMVGVFAAISAALGFWEIALPIFPDFLKIDLSLLPALIGTFIMGPVAGLAIELIKNLVHMTATTSSFIGEFVNILVDAALVIPAGLIYRKLKSYRGVVLGAAAGTVSMAVVGALVNYFIALPLYAAVLGFSIDGVIAMCRVVVPAVKTKFDVILFSIIPFNLLKGAVVSVVTLLAYIPLEPVIKKIIKSR